MSDEWLVTARLAALALAACLAWAFCVTYHVTTRGHWKDDQLGVHLMMFTATDGAILTYAVLSVFGVVPAEWRPAASLVIYTTVAAMIGWRIVLLIRTQRRANSGR